MRAVLTAAVMAAQKVAAWAVPWVAEKAFL